MFEHPFGPWSGRLLVLRGFQQPIKLLVQLAQLFQAGQEELLDLAVRLKLFLVLSVDGFVNADEGVFEAEDVVVAHHAHALQSGEVRPVLLGHFQQLRVASGGAERLRMGGPDVEDARVSQAELARTLRVLASEGRVVKILVSCSKRGPRSTASPLERRALRLGVFFESLAVGNHLVQIQTVQYVFGVKLLLDEVLV